VGYVQLEALAAKQRGVVFDIGHGGGSFDYTVAEAAIQQGCPPDTISSDIHVFSGNTPGMPYLTWVADFDQNSPISRVGKLATVRVTNDQVLVLNEARASIFAPAGGRLPARGSVLGNALRRAGANRSSTFPPGTTACSMTIGSNRSSIGEAQLYASKPHLPSCMRTGCAALRFRST
jgi:hypothetical protein